VNNTKREGKHETERGAKERIRKRNGEEQKLKEEEFSVKEVKLSRREKSTKEDTTLLLRTCFSTLFLCIY
jgi:hypothetical protein